ncbi:MAG: NUDIX domain-containing protein [Saprospiraceae bacterium]|nr:NUDIX domain-containing protein [Saprospiraceae bacterium]
MKAIINEKKILSNKWGEYAEYHITYTRTDGKVEHQVREIQDNGNGAAVLLYHPVRKTVILIQQFRLASMVNGNESGILYEVPAGLVEDGDAEATIKREILEETGVMASDVKYLFSAYATPGAKTEKISFFTATYDEIIESGKNTGLDHEQEDIIIHEIPFENAYEGIGTGMIQDCKTIILLQYAKISLGL